MSNEGEISISRFFEDYEPAGEYLNAYLTDRMAIRMRDQVGIDKSIAEDIIEKYDYCRRNQSKTHEEAMREIQYLIPPEFQSSTEPKQQDTQDTTQSDINSTESNEQTPDNSSEITPPESTGTEQSTDNRSTESKKTKKKKAAQDKPDNSTESSDQNTTQGESVNQEQAQEQSEETTENTTPEQSDTNSVECTQSEPEVQLQNTDNSSEHKPSETNKKKGKKYGRALQAAKGRIGTTSAALVNLSPQPQMTISKEELEEGNKKFKENMQALLDRSTLMDVLALWKDSIKELRNKGYDDNSICQLFIDSFKFPVVTSADLDEATSRKTKKAS